MEFKRLTKTVEDRAQLLIELDRLISKTYENNMLGIIDDKLYEKLMNQYQSEQKELTVTVEDGRKKLDETEEKNVDVRRLIKTLRK